MVRQPDLAFRGNRGRAGKSVFFGGLHFHRNPPVGGSAVEPDRRRVRGDRFFRSKRMRSAAARRQNIPSWSLAASVILLGSQGGSQTTSTFTAATRGTAFTFSWISAASEPPPGRFAAVSAILILPSPVVS